MIGYKYDLGSGIAALSLAAGRNDPHSVFATLVVSPLLNIPALKYLAQTCTLDVHGSGTPNDRVASQCKENGEEVPRSPRSARLSSHSLFPILTYHEQNVRSVPYWQFMDIIPRKPFNQTRVAYISPNDIGKVAAFGKPTR